jgi:hypothetical protein
MATPAEESRPTSYSGYVPTTIFTLGRGFLDHLGVNNLLNRFLDTLNCVVVPGTRTRLGRSQRQRR